MPFTINPSDVKRNTASSGAKKQVDEGWLAKFDDILTKVDGILGKVDKLDEHPQIKKLIESKLGKYMGPADQHWEKYRNKPENVAKAPSVPSPPAQPEKTAEQKPIQAWNAEQIFLTIKESLDSIKDFVGDVKISQLLELLDKKKPDILVMINDKLNKLNK